MNTNLNIVHITDNIVSLFLFLSNTLSKSMNCSFTRMALELNNT